MKLEGESEFINIFKNGYHLFTGSGFHVSWSVVQVLTQNAYASWKVNMGFHAPSNKTNICKKNFKILSHKPRYLNFNF